MNEYLKTIKERKTNLFLRNKAESFFDNKDIISIFAHGSQDRNRTRGIGIRYNTDNYTDTKKFKTFLEKNSELWNKNCEKGEKSVLFFLSCAVGKGENSFAEQVSRDLKCIVIAASENINCVNTENPQVYEKGVLFDKGGYWNVFYDGKLVDQMQGEDGFFSKSVDIKQFIKNLNVKEFSEEMRKKFENQN